MESLNSENEDYEDCFLPSQAAWEFLQGRGKVSYLIAIPEISIHGINVLLAFGLMEVKLRSTAPRT